MAERVIDFLCDGHVGTFSSSDGELRVEISVNDKQVPGVVLTGLHTAVVMRHQVFDLILGAMDELGFDPAETVRGISEAAVRRSALEARHG